MGPGTLDWFEDKIGGSVPAGSGKGALHRTDEHILLMLIGRVQSGR